MAALVDAARATPVAVALAGSALLIRLLGLRRAAKVAWTLADRLPRAREAKVPPAELAQRQARMIARVGETMPARPRCLPRALLLAAVLRRRRVAADLVLGVRVAQPFDAHAWVELEGRAVNEAPTLASDYRALWHLPNLTA